MADFSYLFQWQNEFCHLALSYELSKNFIGIVTLVLACFHDLGDNSLHFFLFSYIPKQLLVENLWK